MKTKITKKAIMSAYRNVIKVGYCDMLNKCAKSITRYLNYDLAKIYLKNNLDELVRGIEYDFYSYNFASADENLEIKRK